MLLFDEAQAAPVATLNEIRLLGSERFDSSRVLTVVLVGGDRLTDRFRDPALLGLDSRIRTCLTLQPLAKGEPTAFLSHLLGRAGNPGLLTAGLKALLVDHAAGNPRVPCTLAAERLDHALHKSRPVVDEAFYFEIFDRAPRRRTRS